MTKFLRTFGISAIFSALTATVAGMAAPAMAQDLVHTVDPIAVTGEPAPGTGGLSFGCIEPWPADLSDSGIVAFLGSLEFLYGAFVNDSGDLAVHAALNTSTSFPDNGIWTRSAGILSLLAKTGDTAPGAVGLPFSNIGAGGFNNLGITTFWASAGDEFGWQAGLWSGTPGALQSLVFSGDPAPGTAGLYFADIDTTSAHSDSVAFLAQTTDPDPNLSAGIWTVGPASVNPVALAGDPAPGTGGRVIRAFRAEPGMTPEQTPVEGELFSYRFGHFALDQAGDVAFTAYVDPLDAADIYSDAGIWVRNAAGLGLAALTGEIAPGTPSERFLYFNHVNFNASGQVAFAASLDIADPTSDHGIWAGLPGSLNLIVREGDPAPGTAGETFGSLVMGPSLNDSGEVAFFARLSESGADGVWVATSDGSLSLIAREGETIQIKSGDFRSIQSIEPFDGGMGGYSFFNVFNGAGQLAFTATFTDGATALLLASPVTTSPNLPPMADVGADQTVAENNTILVDGSASNDPDGTILTFVWSVDGVEIATGPEAILGPFGPGNHTLTLTVTDRGAASASDDMILTVLSNQPPVADAGPDQAVNHIQTATLDGSGSFDPEGSTLTYVWSLNGGQIATGVTATVGPFAVGDQIITLTVTDDTGESASDNMILSVVNGAPTASAGPDGNIQTLETILLDGTASSDPEGEALSYIWRLSGAQIATGPTPTVGPFDSGVHSVTLTVTDGHGASASDETIITVSNRAPIASAGLDQTVSHAQAVALDGSGSSDPENGALSHAWSIGGGQIATGSSPTVGPFAVGVHTVTLTVTDDHGATATDSMVITVINEAPVANAGPDQMVALPKSKIATVTVDGSASTDPEGNALSYLWTLAGQSVGTGAIVQLDLTKGVYGFTLTVTDDHGATAVDSVVVTVAKGAKS
jgi:PKD repeat protein